MVITDLVTWYQEKGINVWINLLIAVAIILIFNILSTFFTFVIVKIFNGKSKKKKNVKENAFYKPIRTFFWVLGIYLAIVYLKLPDSFMKIANKLFRITTIILIAKGFANILEPNSVLYNQLKNNAKIAKNEGILKVISKITKIIVYTIATFIIISEFGYDLNGIIAGLGLGSVVIALAAQDIAKSILAGAAIFMDRPFAIGDYVKAKEYEGTVEDINFRSTKIRLLSGSLVNIPNQVLTTECITNWNTLELRRIDVNLGLMLDTRLKRVKKLIEEIEQTLKQNPNIVEQTVNVYFTEITDSSINVKIYCNTTITNYSEFLKLKQDINFLLMQLLEDNGVKLAYPSQDIYIRS